VTSAPKVVQAPIAAPKPPTAPQPGPVAAKRVPQPAQSFVMKMRHYGLLGSLVATVAVPTILSAFYLFGVADDQYTSQVGFAVRSEEITSALGLLGGLSSLSGASSSDTDILYHFIRSQELVDKIDSRIDLRKIYSVPEYDPVFAFDPSGSIEDLTSYWGSMVRVLYDKGTGLIELRVHAFRPDDAQKIAQLIFDESSSMINELSAVARQDATRYARQELDLSTTRLSEARVALTEFRSRTQLIDPSANLQGQLGLLNSLQQQQAQAMIELSLLRETAQEGDPRINQAERRIAVIDTMMAEERRKFGVGGGEVGDGKDYSTLVGEFERLSVEREFAERAYIAALTAYDNATAEAQRKSRYLAAYVGPTLAEDALYPQRIVLTSTIFGFALLIWGTAALVYYSVRDRR